MNTEIISTGVNPQAINRKPLHSDNYIAVILGKCINRLTGIHRPKFFFKNLHPGNHLTNRIMKNIYTFFATAFPVKSNFSKLFTLILLAALLVAGINPVEAQTPVNKQLYLKSGQLLNREKPTAESPQKTAALYKQQAVVDNISTGTSGTGLGIVSPMTISHTTGTGLTNSIILVTIVSDPATSVVTTVKYNNVGLTKLDEAINTGEVRTSIWYLKNPAAGTHDVVITWSPTTQLQIIAGVTTLYNVNLLDTFGPVAKATGTNSTGSTINVASAPGDFIFDALGFTGTSIAAGGSQSLIFNTFTNKLRGGSSDRTAAASPATSTPMSWTWGGGSKPWAHIGVALKGFSNETTFTQSPTLCAPFTIKADQTITVIAHAYVTSGTVTGTSIPFNMHLHEGTTQIFKQGSATKSASLGATGTSGTLTWTGTIASDYTIPAGGGPLCRFLL